MMIVRLPYSLTVSTQLASVSASASVSESDGDYHK